MSHHRHLGHVVLTQVGDGRAHGLVGVHMYQLRRSAGVGGLAGQYLGDGRLVRRPVEEAVVVHPLVVEDFRQVAAAGVRQQHHHAAVRVQLPSDPQRRDDREPARAADQDAFATGQFSGHQERVAVTDRLHPVDHRLVVGRRPDVLTDSFDQVGSAAAAGVHRSFRVRAHHRHPPGAGLLEVPAGSADRPTGADSGDEVSDTSVRCRPDLRAGGGAVRGRVVGIGVLVRAPGAGRLRDHPARDRVVRAGVVRGDRGRADQDLGSVGPQHRLLLFADLVGHGEHAAVATGGGDDGQADPGVSAGRFDDRPTRPELSRFLRGSHHGHCDPVLHGATRVQILQLAQYGRRDARGDRVQPDQRGIADRRGKVVVETHSPPSPWSQLDG